MAQYLIGVDVGTGSARAGVFDRTGRLLAVARRAIGMHREDGGIAEQSSEQVWGAVCASVREAVANAGIDPGPGHAALDAQGNRSDANRIENYDPRRWTRVIDEVAGDNPRIADLQGQLDAQAVQRRKIPTQLSLLAD